MSFCGSREGSLSVKGGILKNKCFVDVMNIIPHGIFIVTSVLILIAWSESILGKMKPKIWVLFKLHSLRYLLTCVLFLVSGLEIAEGFVSDYLDPDSMNYHVFLPPCFSLVGCVLSLILYHNIEMWNSPRFLMIFLLYWPSAFGLKLLKMFSLYATGIQMEHLRLWVTCTVVTIYGALTVVEIAVLLMQRHSFFKTPRKIHAPAELEKTRYYANFTNFLSKATFWWVNTILIEGFKSPITLEQLGKLPSSERALTNYKCLLQAFEIERDKAARKNQQPSLHKIYLRAFWPMLLLAGLFRLTGDLLAFVGPWCIESIVNYAYSVIEESGQNTTSTPTAFTYSPSVVGNLSVNQSAVDEVHSEYFATVEIFLNNGYGLGILLFVATLIQHTLLQNHHYLVIRQGIRLRAAIQMMVYNKALKMSSLNVTNGKTTIGQIVNHMSMDSTFLMMQFFFIHYIWATPLQVAIAIMLMYFKLGLSAVLGGLLVVLSAPAQVYVGKGMSKMQKKVMQQADVRVKQCNEMIQGIKVIKLLAWETFIAKGINESRRKELKFLLKNAVFRALFTFLGTAVPALATLLTFVLYPYIEDQPLTAGKALSTLALFNILSVPLVLFSMMTSTLIMANVSAKRLIPYFLCAEVEGVQGVSDTMKPGTESLPGDLAMDHEHEDIQLNLLTAEHKNDPLNISMCSLASHHSHIGHGPFASRTSRQNSSCSLTEYNTEYFMNPAAALSANAGNHHVHGFRRQPPSGMSIEELECDPQYALEIHNGCFSWDLDTQEVTLKHIDVQIPTGKLIMVVGTVGSGKTSLLSAMLGEMLTVSGRVQWCRNSSIAYVSQKPWLLNKTLKDNILFGRDFSWKRYQKVIESCALQPDIDSLPAGDLTEIGEKGINLSGGQKQRVSIARALYSSADIIIMDDPLSALDAHVGRHVFDDVIMKKFMRRRKTVVLVTHQLQYLNYAHSVLVMKDGHIECQGKLSEVKKSHPELYESWRKALKDAKTAESSRKDSDGPDGTIDHLPVQGHRPTRQLSEISQLSNSSIEEVPAVEVSQEANGKISPCGLEMTVTVDEGTDPIDEDLDKGDSPVRDSSIGKLIRKEHQEVGSVSIWVYLAHLKACGTPFVIICLVILVVNHVLLVSTNVWVSIWASESTKFVKTTRDSNSTEEFDNMRYIPVYCALSLCAVLATLISGFVVQLSGIRGAKNMHKDLLYTVMKCPMRFFDTNPSGRILNRFSSDIGQVDQKIPSTWESFLRCAFATIAAIIVNCMGTPYFILAALPVCILYYLMQRFYTATARELQRLDSVTKSPIFSHLSETLSGLQTIRAYKVQSRFRQTALSAIDSNVAPFLFSQTANRWLGIRLDYIGAILVFISSMASLTAGLAGQTDPAFVGLCIAYALMVSNYLNWIVRNATELEMMMNAVERVDEYIKLQTETTEAEESTKESCWPSVGKIEFRHVSLCYDLQQDPVVSDVSFTIKPGEKVGICGRTGSGKSSLTLSLFRMIEISNGEILIDNRNISHIALPELRSKLAIIPQDPILFTGTIRYNLDPTGEIEDSKLWNALESVQLKDTIDALPDKLDASVSEGGENFSIGQKQLFCLARAFLRDNKVLVLDEATASIDLLTDNKLQRVISTVFKEKTVVTIAHRISTIMKYDRVMTMADGRMLEFDSPSVLLEKENSHFAQLVKHSYK